MTVKVRTKEGWMPRSEDDYDPKKCSCGSGLEKDEEYDARGIICLGNYTRTLRDVAIQRQHIKQQERDVVSLLDDPIINKPGDGRSSHQASNQGFQLGMTHRPTEIDVRNRLDRIRFSVRHMLAEPFIDLPALDRIASTG